MPDIKLVGRQSYISPRTYGQRVKMGQTIRVKQEDADALLQVLYNGTPIFTTTGTAAPAYDLRNRSMSNGVIAAVALEGTTQKLVVPGSNTPVTAVDAAIAPVKSALSDDGYNLRKARLDRLGAKPIGFNAYELVYRQFFDPSYDYQTVFNYVVQSGANLVRIAYPVFFASDYTNYVFRNGLPPGEIVDSDFKPSFLAISDSIMNAAAASKVKLLVCMFFNALVVPGMKGETLIQGLKVGSASYDYMVRFTRWFAKRYADHPGFGAYSFFNEVRYDPAGVVNPTPADIGAVHSGLVAEMRKIAPLQVATTDYNLFVLNLTLTRPSPESDFEYIRAIGQGVDALGVHAYSYAPDGTGMNWVGFNGTPQAVFGPAANNTLGFEGFSAYLSALRSVAESMGAQLWLTEAGIPDTIDPPASAMRRKRLLKIAQNYAEVTLLWNVGTVASPQPNQVDWQIKPGETRANTWLPLIQRCNNGRVPIRHPVGGGTRSLRARFEPSYCMSSNGRTAGATIRVTSNASMTSATQAVMFWYRRDAALLAFETLMDTRGAGNAGGFAFVGGATVGTDIEYMDFRGSSATAVNTAGFSVPMPTGEWTHFAFIFRPINNQIAVEIWMNGMLWGAKSAANAYAGIPSGTTLYFCGGSANGAPVSFQDIALMPMAMPEDIWNHMAGSVLPQSYLHLRADTNGITDFSRNGLALTLGSGTVIGPA